MGVAKKALLGLLALLVVASLLYAISWSQVYVTRGEAVVEVPATAYPTATEGVRVLTLRIPEAWGRGKFVNGNLTVNVSCRPVTIAGSAGYSASVSYLTPEVRLLAKLNGRVVAEKWGNTRIIINSAIREPGLIEIYLVSLGLSTTCEVHAEAQALYKILPVGR